MEIKECTVVPLRAEVFFTREQCTENISAAHWAWTQLCDPEHREQGYKLEKVTHVGLDLVQITWEGNFVPYKRSGTKHKANFSKFLVNFESRDCVLACSTVSDIICKDFKGKIPRGISWISTNLSSGLESAEGESTKLTEFTVACLLTKAHGLFQLLL